MKAQSKLVTFKQDEKDDSEGIKSLPTKKCGRPLLLGNDLDENLQLYLKKI